jgi:BirA family biotin operon repressor/biotin-[acetyl-CoA-carboxylase] ligase
LPSSSLNNNIGVQLIEINSVGSTNNYAMELVHKGLSQHGLVIFAHEQTAGKGQRGRQWHSTRGENIIISVILDTTTLQINQQFLLSMSMALAVNDFFRKHAGDESSVKWPNDLYWGDRKAGGILIENVITGKEWQWAIIGIGVNINQTIFDKTAFTAVSLKQITGKNQDPLELAKELCTNLDHRFRQLQHNSKQRVVDAYNDILYKKGQKVSLKKNNIIFDCLIKGVNEYGYLITESATEQLFNIGEVQWIKRP